MDRGRSARKTEEQEQHYSGLDLHEDDQSIIEFDRSRDFADLRSFAIGAGAAVVWDCSLAANTSVHA